MFIVALLLAGCQTTPTVTEPTPENAARQFEAVAFGADYGTGGDLVRWRWGPVVTFYADDAPLLRRYEPEFTAAFEQVEETTRIRFNFTTKPKSATLHVVFTERSQFLNVASAQDVPGQDRGRLFSTAACAAQLFHKDGADEITGALVLIGTDIPGRERSHCILEEIVQIMGLPADACHYRPSLFCEGDERLTAMTEADKILLRTLYDERLKPGMTKAEAMPIARQIIAEQMQ